MQDRGTNNDTNRLLLKDLEKSKVVFLVKVQVWLLYIMFYIFVHVLVAAYTLKEFLIILYWQSLVFCFGLGTFITVLVFFLDILSGLT